MIPTIQLVYGSMPKITNLENKSILEYNSDFYLNKDVFELLRSTNYYCSDKEQILTFLCKTFQCFCNQTWNFKTTDNSNPRILYNFHDYSFNFSHRLTLYNMNSSEIINRLITDDFYDSFQVLLNNLKTQ